MIPGLIAKQLKDILAKKLGDLNPADFVSWGESAVQGDLYTTICLTLAKKAGDDPVVLAQEVADQLGKQSSMTAIFDRIEVAGPGFINFYFSPSFLQKNFAEISHDKNYGRGNSLNGKTVMVEYTDPNPFKLLHIGHLMSNAIGECIARLHEAVGAKVIRANYPGDAGVHVAKAIWAALQHQGAEYDLSSIAYWGKMYAFGAKAFAESEESKTEIKAINEKIYNRSDEAINTLYDRGRRVSLDSFEVIYKKLGTKFDQYFFESEIAGEAVSLVKQYPEVFVASEGAVIFKGEDYGLHTRVFVNSQGLPVYEAKELALNKKKFEVYPGLSLSIVVTSNEIVEYFKVLLKAMSLTIPDVGSRTRHIAHGMLRLPTGKMSSRTGDVITAESLIQQTKEKIQTKQTDKHAFTAEEAEQVREQIAIGAIKYSILRQSPGKDIIFDFEKSLAVEGDSGPYLQYTYARLRGILEKAQYDTEKDANVALLTEPTEIQLLKYFIRFPDVVAASAAAIAPQHIATYLQHLAGLVNGFYENVQIIGDENADRVQARLVLVDFASQLLKHGLDILGIPAPEKM